MSNNDKIEEHPRFRSVVNYLKSKIKFNSKVLEVGDNDATFNNYVEEYEDWITLDNCGSPDLKIDIAKPELNLPLVNSSIDIINE